jgi:hypothetical protein
LSLKETQERISPKRTATESTQKTTKEENVRFDLISRDRGTVVLRSLQLLNQRSLLGEIFFCTSQLLLKKFFLFGQDTDLLKENTQQMEKGKMRTGKRQDDENGRPESTDCEQFAANSLCLL